MSSGRGIAVILVIAVLIMAMGIPMEAPDDNGDSTTTTTTTTTTPTVIEGDADSSLTINKGYLDVDGNWVIVASAYGLQSVYWGSPQVSTVGIEPIVGVSGLGVEDIKLSYTIRITEYEGNLAGGPSYYLETSSYSYDVSRSDVALVVGDNNLDRVTVADLVPNVPFEDLLVDLYTAASGMGIDNYNPDGGYECLATSEEFDNSEHRLRVSMLSISYSYVDSETGEIEYGFANSAYVDFPLVIKIDPEPTTTTTKEEPEPLSLGDDVELKVYWDYTREAIGGNFIFIVIGALVFIVGCVYYIKSEKIMLKGRGKRGIFRGR